MGEGYAGPLRYLYSTEIENQILSAQIIAIVKIFLLNSSFSLTVVRM